MNIVLVTPEQFAELRALVLPESAAHSAVQVLQVSVDPLVLVVKDERLTIIRHPSGEAMTIASLAETAAKLLSCYGKG